MRENSSNNTDHQSHGLTTAMAAGVLVLIGLCAAEQFKGTKNQTTAVAKQPSQVWDGKMNGEIAQFLTDVGTVQQSRVIKGVAGNATCPEKSFHSAGYEIQISCAPNSEYIAETASANVTVTSINSGDKNNAQAKRMELYTGYYAPGIHGFAIY